MTQPGAAARSPTTCSRPTPPLREALEREGGGWGADRFADIGALAGTREALEHSERCERNEPVLRTHDRYGNRVDEVELDPSWHWLLREAVERGMHSLPWRDPQPGAHTVRAGLMFMLGPGQRGRDVPRLDDLLGHPRAARGARRWPQSGSRGSCQPDYDGRAPSPAWR